MTNVTRSMILANESWRAAAFSVANVWSRMPLVTNLRLRAYCSWVIRPESNSVLRIFCATLRRSVNRLAVSYRPVSRLYARSDLVTSFSSIVCAPFLVMSPSDTLRPASNAAFSVLV